MARATTRREFVSQSIAAGAATLFLPARSPASSSQPDIHFPSSPRDRIAVASYPFREFIPRSDYKSGNPAIAFIDFAAHVADRFAVTHIEPWSTHFPSTNPGFLAGFRKSVETAHSAVVNIAVDGDESLYAKDFSESSKALAFRKHWVDVALEIGSPSVRTNIAPAKDAKPDAARLAERLKPLAEYGEAQGIVVHLENDNPESEDPFLLARVIDEVKSPWLRALPDFGNTLNAHDEDYAYRGIDAMFAHAYGICHVKDGEVNESGKVSHVDLARTFAILHKEGYKGYCSIEYDSPGDPYKATANLIQQTLEYLGRGRAGGR